MVENDRDAVTEVLLTLDQTPSGWRRQGRPLTAEQSRLFEQATEDDFELAIAALEAVATEQGRDFVETGYVPRRPLYLEGRLRGLPFALDFDRLAAAVEPLIANEAALLLRLEALRDERRRRFPPVGSPRHGWGRHHHP